MSLLFHRRSGSSPFPEPVVPPFPGVSPYGVVTASNAMQLDTVWSCVRLLSDTVSMLPVIGQSSVGGVVQPLPAGRPLSRWVQSPAANLSMSAWLRQMMVSLLLKGNAFGIVSYASGYPSSVVPINPDEMSCTVSDGNMQWLRKGIPVPDEQLFHMTFMRMPGTSLGLSPITYAASLFSEESLIQAFARGFFKDAPQPTGILSTEQPVNQEQAKEIKDRYKSNVQGREPIVLGNGVAFKPLSISPEESQFLATRKLNVSRICRIFGVPPEMVGGAADGSNVTYSNVTQRAMDFLTYSIQPWLKRFEDAVTQLFPGTQSIQFDTSELVRMSPTDHATVDKERIANGSRTINEARAGWGEPPVDWGDVPYLPGFGPTAAGNAVLGATAHGMLPMPWPDVVAGVAPDSPKTVADVKNSSPAPPASPNALNDPTDSEDDSE